MRKPLTTLVVDAMIAMKPSTTLAVLCFVPVIVIEPTMAIAEIALVSDISGVCNSGDTRRITSNPMNVASMNTNNMVVSCEPSPA